MTDRSESVPSESAQSEPVPSNADRDGTRRRRLRLPLPHWPSVRGRARADAGPLTLVAVVVAVVSLLAGAVPPLEDRTADRAVQEAIRTAGPEATVRAQEDWEYDDALNGGRQRQPQLAADLSDWSARADQALDPDLRAVLAPPVTVVTSTILRVTDGSVLRTFEIAYLSAANNAKPQVTWVSGGPPRASGTTDTIAFGAPPWQIQVGLSEADATALGLTTGDHVQVMTEQRVPKNVLVSGVYRATDPDDPAWRLVPSLLGPQKNADGLDTTRLAGLLSADSLPDARLAFDFDQLTRTVSFSPDPDTLTAASAGHLADIVVKLKATSGTTIQGYAMRWQTQIDNDLHDALARVGAGRALANVLLIGILTGAVLVLLLAAGLLVRRREQALTQARQRGASLPAIGVELLIESAAVALVAAVAGLSGAVAVAHGLAPFWAVPVVLAAVLAGPVLGVVVAARATRDRRTPANRSVRLWARRTAILRRVTAEAAVVVIAVAAVVALNQRSLTADDASGISAAPALGILAGGIVLLRLLPYVVRRCLRLALRGDRPLFIFGLARAAEMSARLLPPLMLVTATGLAAFALTLGATTSTGLVEGARETVGADARVDVFSEKQTALAGLARTISGLPGVDRVVTAQIVDGAPVVANSALLTPRLIIVDTAAYHRLQPSAPAIGRGQALVRSSDGSLAPGMKVHLSQQNIDLTAVGVAPRVDDAPEVVIVDASSLTPVPNAIWADGPGVSKIQAPDGFVTLRDTVLDARRDEPLTAAMITLSWAAAATLAVLALLGFALSAAAGAPERWLTLTRLRTLGLTPREGRRVATVELLPAILVAAAGGPLLGVLLARFTLGPLALNLLTGQTADPSPVVPALRLLPLALVLLVAPVVVVPFEAAARRRRNLGEVLRAGD